MRTLKRGFYPEGRLTRRVKTPGKACRKVWGYSHVVKGVGTSPREMQFPINTPHRSYTAAASSWIYAPSNIALNNASSGTAQLDPTVSRNERY